MTNWFEDCLPGLVMLFYLWRALFSIFFRKLPLNAVLLKYIKFCGRNYDAKEKEWERIPSYCADKWGRNFGSENSECDRRQMACVCNRLVLVLDTKARVVHWNKPNYLRKRLASAGAVRIRFGMHDCVPLSLPHLPSHFPIPSFTRFLVPPPRPPDTRRY